MKRRLKNIERWERLVVPSVVEKGTGRVVKRKKKTVGVCIFF